MADGSNAANGTAGYDSMIDGEIANALLPEIPDFDEDLDEAFTGPRGGGPNLEEWDESYDDEYEAETAAIFEGSQPQAVQSSDRDVSVDTQLGAALGSSNQQ